MEKSQKEKQGIMKRELRLVTVDIMLVIKVKIRVTIGRANMIESIMGLVMRRRVEVGTIL